MAPEFNYPELPPVPTLARAKLHVWIGDTGRLATNTRHGALLSSDEAERAAHLRDEAQRKVYITARTYLRLLLARYLAADARGGGPEDEGALARRAGSLRFSYNPAGKPALAEATDLQFNLAHSHTMVAYVIGRGREVGIDLEQIHLGLNDLPLYALTRSEQAWLAGLPQAERDRWFFQQWVRKEAWLKAVGVGLQRPLDSFTIGTVPTGPGDLLPVLRANSDVEPWAVADLDVGPGYAAAVAATGHDWAVTYI